MYAKEIAERLIVAERQRESLKDSKEEEDKQLYKGAFDDFDWNKNGTIPTRVVFLCPLDLQYYQYQYFLTQDLQYAMRRAGQNPTDVEVQDLINKIDDGTGTLDFNDFCVVIKEKNKELDFETHFKDTFRAFSKDDEGDDMTGTPDNFYHSIKLSNFLLLQQ